MGPPPRTATAPDIKDAVEHCALGVFGPAASRLGLGDLGFNQRPFGVGYSGRVRVSRFHAPEDNPSSLPNENF
jgi:hypothetical protein